MDRRTLLKSATALAASSLAATLPAFAANDKASKLLLVHGRAQQGRVPADIKKEWLDALETGMGRKLPSSIEVSLPFYGDTLDGYAQQLQIPLTSEIQARGNNDQEEFLVFQAQVAEEIRLRAGVTDAQVDAEYGDDPQARGPLNWKWVQAILRAVDKHSPGMNQKAIETFTRDVFLYTTRAGVRDAIDHIVARELSDQPTVVIGHSLGTVVAYSVLSRDPRALRVPLYVTVGSPLAIRAVRDQFRPIRRPAFISDWYNAFDTRDVVALYPLDDRNFPARPAIENNSSVRNKTDNRHGISGYLDDRKVGRKVEGSLALQD
jgi:hypothetical protein